MTDPEHRVTLAESRKAEFVDKTGLHQPNSVRKKAFITEFLINLEIDFRKGRITEAEKNELEQMAREKQRELGNS